MSTEYNRQYQWEDSWKNSDYHPRRENYLVHPEEPVLQHKRRIGPSSDFSLSKHFNQSNDDDYFLVGRTNNKFASSVAYRNAAKLRARSSEQVKRGSSSQNADSKQHIRKAPKTSSKSVQTSDFKTMNSEIKRIKSQLNDDKRKLKKRLHHGSIQTVAQKGFLQSDDHKRRREILKRFPEVRLNLNSETSRKSDSLPAPRVVQTAINRKADAPHSQFVQTLRPSTAPNLSRLSEYQQSYIAPSVLTLTKPKMDANVMFYNSNKYNSMSTKSPCELCSEYTMQYRPFIYVNERAADKIKSKIENAKSNKENTATLAKRSASITNVEQKVAKSEDKQRRLKHHYISEYSDKFRSIQNRMETMRSKSLDEVNLWKKSLMDLKNQANIYRERFRQSHFSRDHLAQLESTNNDMWNDPIDSVRSVPNHYDSFVLPPAGLPTSNFKSINPQSSSIAQNYTTDSQFSDAASSISGNTLTEMETVSPWRNKADNRAYKDDLSYQDTDEEYNLRYKGSLQNYSNHPQTYHTYDPKKYMDDKSNIYVAKDAKFTHRNTNNELYKHNDNIPHDRTNFSRLFNDARIVNHEDDKSSVVSSLASLTERSIHSNTKIAEQTLQRARENYEHSLKSIS